MEELTMEGLYRSYYRKVQQVSMEFHRYLYTAINWDNWVIGIKGERGVGKTTLLLQHIKETFPTLEKALYVSLDNLWFSTHPLTKLVEHFYTHGGTHLFLDEVHRYANWQTVLKNLCDDYPDLHIVYTSSSMLQIDRQQGDMSRRQIVYTLRGMSFREYLEFEGLYTMQPIALEDLLSAHSTQASLITSQNFKVLPSFEAYLRHGYYPFYKREADGFEFRLQEVVNQVLESDLPAVEEISYATLRKARRMLMMMAERVPQLPKMSEVYNHLETTRDVGLKILHALQRAGLLGFVSVQQKAFKSLSSPDKILVGNPNLMYALTAHVDVGAMRESFFLNQLSVNHEVLLPKHGDFWIDRKLLFEVGGKTKDFSQIKDIPNSYLAVADTEIGMGNRIPLWMFGLLY